ncbi:transcriptional regulator [uncultured Campylobacter sp.]|uniref:transcriptional regulator n=1 Tax=uncultured Campylobacter sp. TaxID=218934 RepID=UPI0026345F68|nr:transcriptional regulator [uncultured Campylobacter sp.]
MRHNLSQRDIAGILKIDTKTLYNWRKNKPELYRIVMLGFKFDELLKQVQKNLDELQDLAEGNAGLRLK